MRRGALRRFKAVLEREQAAAIQRLMESRERMSIERSADAVDETSFELERELALANISRDSETLREIRAALLRIAQGTFGMCVSCGDEIGPKRLAAVPWSPLCLRCQEAADQQGETAELLQGVSATAA
jgi:RNA polymerase-binding transcription factor